METIISRKSIVYALLVALSSYLFFNEGMGINTVLFIGLLFGAIYSLPLRSDSNKFYGIFFLAGSIISAGAVLFIHSFLSVICLIVFALLCVAHRHLETKSVFIGLINASYSVLATPFILIFNKFLGSLESKSANQKHTNRSQQLAILRISTVAIPVLGALAFTMLYASANPLFSKMIEQFSFDWLPFTIMLSILFIGVIFFHPLNSLNSWYELQGFRIVRKRVPLGIKHPLSLKFELRTAIIMLTLLNVLIIIFNVSDISSLVSGIAQDDSFSHAEFVHQGVYTLIFSIVLAITILLYYFRGNINFFKSNTLLKQLAYTWILQNLVLAFTSAYKNLLYIQEFSLTYKRIGVFIYLLLVVVGLITTFQKLRYRKTLWYLLHVNTWVMVMLLFLSSLIPWDIMITKYNLQKDAEPDFTYLIDLSDTNIPQLLPYLEDDSLPFEDKRLLENKIKAFQENEEAQSWLSWNYQDHLTKKSLLNSRFNGQ